VESKALWNLDSLLRSNDRIVVMGAPFGIGKSSLSEIIHDCAIKYIQSPLDSIAYIPVFVLLRFALATNYQKQNP
jgi:hypothetical protein